ncbi:MAG: sugar ABC transporter permease [Nitriliruptor sp.]|nr:MAG: sugar ABC transporter permease [Nitriliruptor sp.]
MRRSKLAGRSLLLPAVLILLSLSLFPLLFSLVLSFGDWGLGRGFAYDWRGLDNFARLLQDGRYRNAATNSGIYVVVSVSAQYVIGLGLAWLLWLKPPGGRLFQVLFILPMMLAPVAVGYMWRLMFQSRIGAINHFLGLVGIDPVLWMSSRRAAMTVIILTETWQWTPFVFLFLYAAMLNIPRDPIEAALVDGASGWQVFRHIMLPMLTPISIAVVMLRSVEALKILDTVYVITHGGPGNTTESLTFYAYNQGLQYFNLGYASAIAFSLLIVVVAIAIPIVVFVKKDVEFH